MAKNPSETSPSRILSDTPKAKETAEESDEIKLKRAREKARREKQKEEAEKQQERKGKRSKKVKGIPLEEFQARLRAQEPPVAPDQEQGEEKREEEKPVESGKPWEIEAIEEAQKELTREDHVREEEMANAIKEAEERERKEKAESAEPAEPKEERDERKEKWPSDVARAIDEAYNKFETAKHDNNAKSRLKDLQVDVGRMIQTYQNAMQHKWPPLPDEESRLLQLKHDIENQLASMIKEGAPLEEQQTREEKIAAFRARGEEIKRKNKEEGWASDEDFQKFGQESYDRGTAEHYNFDTGKINEAIEQAKRERNVKYGEQSVERLERAKALIESEIGVEVSPPPPEPARPPAGQAGPAGGPAPTISPEPLAEKTGDGTKEIKIEMPSEEDRDALKRKLFPEQFRKEEKKESVKEPVAATEQKEEPKVEKTEESPEMKAAVEEMLGGEMRENVRVQEAAARVYRERTAMLAKWPEILEHKRIQERQLPEEMGRVRRWLGIGGGRKTLRFAAAQGTPDIHLERLESEKAYDAAREVFIHTTIEEMRKEGRSESDITGRLVELDNAETLRVLDLREKASPHEWVGRLTKLAQGYNRAFEWPLEQLGIDKKYARHVRIVTSAALMTGIGFASGALAGGAIALYAGRRVAMPYVMGALNGLGTAGINLSSERVLRNQLGRLSGERREALNRQLEGTNRTEALEESLREQRAQFSDRAKAIMERRRMFKRVAQGALIVGNILLASTAAHAFTSVGEVAGLDPDTAPRAHIEIQEDSFRARIDAAWERFSKAGKGSMESMDRLMKRMEEWGITGKSTPEASAGALEEAASPSGTARAGIETLTDEQREEALKQYYGLIESAEKDHAAYLEKSLGYAPTDEWREEALKRYYGLIESAEADRPPSLMTPEQAEQLRDLQEKGVLTDEQIETLKRNWEGRPPLLTAEEIEKLQALREKGVLSSEQIESLKKAWEGKLDAAGEPIATIGKGGNIWEASRSLIGEGEGKISKDQWLEAWEKSGLADKGFVKPGATIHFDPEKGIFEIKGKMENNEFLYQALTKEGKLIPEWLEKARGIAHHAPTPGEQAALAAALAEARPAMAGDTFEEILRERAAGGATLREFIGNHDAYMKEFEGASLADQEAKIADIERGFEHLRGANQLEGMSRSEMRPDFLDYERKYDILLKQLQENPAYLEHGKAWGAFKHAWEVDGGFRGEKAYLFDEMLKKWTVQEFLDTNRKLMRGAFEPRIGDSLGQHIEIHRNGFLGLSQEVVNKILEQRPSPHTNLGRFLKNTL